MFANYPVLLRQASLGLLVALLGFVGVLLVSTPLPYIATMTLGGMGLVYSVGCYLRFFIKELKTPDSES